MGFTVSPGDCLLLTDTFYCAEDIKLGEVTFKATYKWATRHHHHLEIESVVEEVDSAISYARDRTGPGHQRID